MTRPIDQIFGGKQIHTVVVVETATVKAALRFERVTSNARLGLDYLATCGSRLLRTPAVPRSVPVVYPVLPDMHVSVMHVHYVSCCVAPRLYIRNVH